MVGLKRRRIVEGWELDVSDSEADVKQLSLLRRLAENNKIWALSLVVIVLGTGLVLKFGQRGLSNAQKAANDPPPAASQYCDDAEHRDFARAFIGSKSHGTQVLDARFVGADRFYITVPGDVGSDDIAHLSQIAAWKIVKQFKHRSVVAVYLRSASGVRSLAATTMWDPKKFGFVVKSGDQPAEPAK